MSRVERALAALRIDVKRQGDRLWGLCPFHEDHNPSWFVRRSGERAGQWHCFACQEGGTLPMLIKYVLSVDDAGARDWLAKLDAGEAPGPAEAPEVEVRPSRAGLRGFALPLEVRVAPVASWPSLPRAYVAARGITPHQVDRWGLGYAASGRLEGRLVIVVRDASGTPRGYMARDFTGEDAKRYLYPTAVERADLDTMFGEQHWPRSGRRCVVVTEGALDALAVERVTHGPVAALGGSMVRPMHVAKLSTFAAVVVLTDADPAGDAAAAALTTALGRHVGVRRVRLPDGQDACTVGPEALAEALYVAVSVESSEAQGPGSSTADR